MKCAYSSQHFDLLKNYTLVGQIEVLIHHNIIGVCESLVQRLHMQLPLASSMRF